MSTRHPQSFRRAFVDALALCHAESVYLLGAVPTRAPMVGDFVVEQTDSPTGYSKRFVSVRANARRALAMEFCAALDMSPYFFGGKDPRSGVHWSLAYEWRANNDGNGGPGVAEYFAWRTGTLVHGESGIWRVPGVPPASGQSSYDSAVRDAAALVVDAWTLWERLDAQVYTPIDGPTAGAARAAVMDARAGYVTRLNALHGAGTYE